MVAKPPQRAGAMSLVLSPMLRWQLQPRVGVGADDLQPIHSIAKLGAPVLVVGGTRDAYTPESETRALFDAARSPKLLWLVPGASHQDFSRFDPAGYRDRVIGFLESTLMADAQIRP